MTKPKCPNCGELFSKLKDGKIPTHDYPRPCRQVCPGTGQDPRTEDDERPLWKDSPLHQSLDFYDGVRRELLVYGFATIKHIASLRGLNSGKVPCPLCQKEVSFSIALSNGHCRAKCETPGCISAME